MKNNAREGDKNVPSEIPPAVHLQVVRRACRRGIRLTFFAPFLFF
jgi:hypothetical protein